MIANLVVVIVKNALWMDANNVYKVTMLKIISVVHAKGYA